MNEETLINVCKAYINWTYLSPNDFVELYGYDSLDNEIVERFDAIMKPIREAWFEECKLYKEQDLYIYAKLLARNLEVLFKELDIAE